MQNQPKSQIPRARPQRFPYEQLTDREFEELLYAIFMKELEGDINSIRYDDVYLMPGVGERGQDCILMYQEKKVGTVQCKHSSNPANRTNKPTAARDIIKFALYYLHDTSLVDDLSDFTYVFAVSGDFSGPAISLLRSFSQNITRELELEVWTKKVLKQHKSLDFSFNAIRDELYAILSRIKVRKITRSDLDIKLANLPDIVKRFFPIQSVAVINSEEDLKQFFRQTIGESFSSIPAVVEVEKALVSQYQEQLNYAQSLLENFNPAQANSFLQDLKSRIWDKASSEEKYRLLAYQGIAHLQQGQEVQAAQLLIDALAFKVESPKGMANAALGYLMQGDSHRCRELAKQALRKDPTLDRAYSSFINATPGGESFSNVLAQIPEAYRSAPEVCIALGDLAQKQGIFAEAEKWFRDAIDNDSKNHPDLRGKLATLLLTELQKNHTLPVPGLEAPYQDTLAEIIDLYDAAWGAVSGTDLRKYRIEWLINRAAAKAMLGDLEEAAKDLDVALLERPNDPLVIRNRAILAYQAGDLTQAANLFRKILEADPKADARFWLAVVLFENGRYDEAFGLAKEALELTQECSLKWEATKLMIFTRLRRGDIQEARYLVNSLRRSYPDNHIATLTLDAMVYRYENDKQNARKLLLEAQSALTAETAPVSQFQLAQELLENGLFENTAAVLERIVDKQVNSAPLRLLTLSYYRSGHLDETLSICQSLRRAFGPLQFVTAIETAIYEEIDDLHSARQVCEEYLTSYPDNIQIQLRHAVVNYRLKEYDALDDFLRSDIDLTPFSVSEIIQFASLLLSRDFLKKALDVMYSARRRYYDDPLIHEFYAMNLFGRYRKKGENEKWFAFTEVTAGTSVHISDRHGNHRSWLTIENDTHADIRRNEIGPDHPIAQKLIGLKVGDCTEISHGLFVEQICIQEIKSKFIHALHDTMVMYPTYFSAEPRMWQFPVQYTEEGEVTAETFQPLFNALDERHSFLESAMQLYREGKFTIGTLGNVLGMNSIEILGTLMQESGAGIRCSSGQPAERRKAVSIASSASRLILDITSLVTLHELNLEDLVAMRFDQLIVVRKTLELIEQLLQDKLLNMEAYMVLGKEGDQYTRGFITEEIIDNNKRFLEQILKWSEKHCVILPCRAALSVKREARQKLGELLGQSFMETVLVASGEDLILYSDDLILRELAEKEYGVSGIWTQSVMLHLKSDNQLPSDAYAKATIKLACLNFHHTAVNAHILRNAAETANWLPVHPFSKVVDILGGLHSDSKSSVRVATEWVHQLWLQKLPKEKYEQLVINTIDALTRHRSQRDRMLVLNTFEAILSRKFHVAPLADRQIRGIVRAWKRAHVH